MSGKIMFVTVGTSLFHSATWEKPPPVVAGLQYSQWLSHKFLRSPKRRLMGGHESNRLREALENKLSEDNAEELSGLLPAELRDGRPYPQSAMRYSAELATIIKLYEEDAGLASKPIPTFIEFLRGYDSIHVAFDPKHDARYKCLSKTAGIHLRTYLNTVSQVDRATDCLVPALSSSYPEQLLGGLRNFANMICEESKQCSQLDLVLTGGFKIYGIVLGTLTNFQPPPIIRAIYAHDDGDRLILVTNRSGTSYGLRLSDSGAQDVIDARLEDIIFD